MTDLKSTYHEMPPGFYPVHMFHPEFNTMKLWFPALDAWVLEMLCRKAEEKLGYGSRYCLEIMEIGTFVGSSASILAPHASTLLCVDTWAGSGKPKDEMKPLYDDDIFAVFQQNTADFYPRPQIHRRTLEPDSLPAFLSSRNCKFDLIFIDGGHDYDSVKADIAIAREWIAPYGIICGHDLTQFEGVWKAACEFGDETNGIMGCGTVWWAEM